MMKSLAFGAVLLVSAPALAQAPAAAPPVAAAQSEDARLAAFFEQALRDEWALSPEALTRFGKKDRYGELDDYTDAAENRFLALREAQLRRMQREFSRDRLSPSSQLSYDLFEDGVRQGRIWHKWRRHLHLISNLGSPAGRLPAFLINAHRVDTVQDAEAYVARLRAVERVMDEIARDLEARTRDGLVAPSFAYAPTIEDARRVMEGAPFTAGGEAPLWADFQKKVRALKLDQAAEARLLRDGREALEGPFRRGYLRFIGAVETMSKASASTDGVWSLPDGDAYYADILQVFTTTRLTPDEIHRIGLAEVARIHREMDAIRARVGYQGTLQEFLAHVKTDPRFTYPNTDDGKQEYLKDAAAFIDRYMAAAEKDFSVLPKAKLEVRAVEAFREKTAPFAFYDSPAADGSRPGY